jgi:ribosome-associated translation inhibitor RaiA
MVLAERREIEGEAMKIPLRTTFLGMPPSDAVEAKIRQRALGLERFSRRITRCEVRVSADHGHHRKGPFYGVSVRLTVPGEEILIEIQPAHVDVYVSIRDAFDAARRRLEDAERGRPGHRRGHEQIRRRPGGRAPADHASSAGESPVES